MVNSEAFAQRLQKILDYYGLSATAFSDRIDFNRSTISHLLSGRNKPSLEFVMKVLEEFPEVELYWLLNGKGSFPAHDASNKLTGIPQPEAKGKEEDVAKEIQESAPENIQKLGSVVSDQEIDRIVIFFKDGSFKSYR